MPFKTLLCEFSQNVNTLLLLSYFVKHFLELGEDRKLQASGKSNDEIHSDLKWMY